MNTGRPPIDRKSSGRNRIPHSGMDPEMRGFYDSGIDALPCEPSNERLMGFADLHMSTASNYSSQYGPIHVQSSPAIPRRVVSMPSWMNSVPCNADAMTYRRVSSHANSQQRECIPEKSDEFILRPPRPSLTQRAFRGEELHQTSELSRQRQKSSHPASFPVKLHQILSDAQYSEYITWLPHGRAFRVLKAKAFEEIVIPKFLRSRRYASFMRQVNGWGFKRITEGPDLNAYYHEMFLRGLPELCAKMRRPKKADDSVPRDLGESPDFYKISTLAPLPETSPAMVSHPSKKLGIAYSGGYSGGSSVSSSEAPPHTPYHVRSGPMSPGGKSEFSTPEGVSKNRSPPFSRTSSLGSGIESITSWPEHYDSLWASAQPFSPVGQMNPRGQQEYATDDVEGLSLADLHYLTEQNRILLQQSRNRSSDHSFN